MRLTTGEIIQEFWQRVYAIAFGICHNKMDAEDVTQDTFVKYHLHKKQFESKEHIQAWLFRVAINKARDCSKCFWKNNKISFDEYMAYEDEDDNLGDDVLREESAIALNKALFELPEKYRIVIHLYYYEDYTCEQISGILTLSPSAVRKRLDRAREMLKNKVKEEFGDD